MKHLLIGEISGENDTKKENNVFLFGIFDSFEQANAKRAELQMSRDPLEFNWCTEDGTGLTWKPWKLVKNMTGQEYLCSDLNYLIRPYDETWPCIYLTNFVYGKEINYDQSVCS